MSGAPGSPGAATSQLAQLQAAAAALRTAVAAGGDHCAAAAAADCAADSSADWESRLAEVNAAVGSTPRNVAANNHAAGQEAGQGSAGAAASSGGGLASYQSELIEAVSSCPGNCVTFLPLGELASLKHPCSCLAACRPGMAPRPRSVLFLLHAPLLTRGAAFLQAWGSAP